MERFLLSLGLAAITIAHAQAQGTIQFSSPFNPVVSDANGQPMSVPFNVAVYFAATSDAWQGPVQPIGRSSATVPGAFTAPNGTAYQIPGTEGGQVVSIQIYVWTSEQGDDPYQAWFAGARTAISGVAHVGLGPTAGPGTVIFSQANPQNPRSIQFGLANPAPPVVPEPSIIALGALAGVALLLRIRKSKNN